MLKPLCITSPCCELDVLDPLPRLTVTRKRYVEIICQPSCNAKLRAEEQCRSGASEPRMLPAPLAALNSSDLGRYKRHLNQSQIRAAEERPKPHQSL